MYSIQPDPDADKLRNLDRRQRRFLVWVAALIPKLIGAVAKGAVESRWILGRRRLKDGRELELLLVARSHKGRDRGGYTPRGGA